MPTSQQVILPQLTLISWQSKGNVQSQTQVHGCGPIYSVHVLHIPLTFMCRCAQIHILRYEATTIYSLHTHGVHLMACPWARYLSRDILSHAQFLCDTAAALGDTIQCVSPLSRYRLYTCLRETHTDVPSKQADSDDACSGGFYFFFLLV